MKKAAEAGCQEWGMKRLAFAITAMAAVPTLSSGLYPASATTSVRHPHTAATVPPRTQGYVLAGADGGVFAFGNASYTGSMGGQRLAAPVSGAAESLDGNGYWLVGQDKGIFAFGDAGFAGSGNDVAFPCFGPPPAVCAVPANPSLDPSPAAGIARTLDDGGYVAAMTDGDVYNYGDAPLRSTQIPASLAAPMVGVAMAADDSGYWLAGADGGVFAVDAAPFYGSLGDIRLAAPVTGIATPPDAGGYWLVASDGGVFAFGDAPFLGSLPGLEIHPAAPIVGMASTPDGKGYWLVGTDGGVFAFGDATYLGSMATGHLAAPVVGISATTSDPLPPCTGTVLTTTTDKMTYTQGQPVAITVTYTNTSPSTCSANVSSATPGCSDAQVFPVVEIGGMVLGYGSQVWDNRATAQGRSTPCPSGVYEQPMAPGASLSVHFRWNQTQCPAFSTPPCPMTPAAPGNYVVWGTWGFDFTGSNAVDITISP
jgi:hypothetical protein